MISTVLSGGSILDGSGRPPFVTDVAIVEDRIAIVGDCSERETQRRIDVRGLIVAAGYIDACSHTDAGCLTPAAGHSKSGQGVTTLVAGFSANSPRECWDEATNVDEAFALVREAQTITNVALTTDAGTVAAFEAGAIGAEIDLRVTTLDEAIARAAGNALAIVRIGADPETALEGVDAAIALAERANVRVHIASFATRADARAGATERALERIDRARSRGESITIDTYPYVATWISLRSLVPPSVSLDALTDESLVAAVALEMQARLGDIWEQLQLAEVASEERMAWCGMRFSEIARRMRVSGARAVLDFVIAEGDAARAFWFSRSEDDIALLYSAPFCAVASDAPALPLHQSGFGEPHPRAFGTFPRVIGRFVRQRNALTMEEAIRRMSALPAQIYGLEDRGRIEEEHPADLVVFDPQHCVDTATYERPRALPAGVHHVYVNGVSVMDMGSFSLARPGRALRWGRG